jgi:hypothetical protein
MNENRPTVVSGHSSRVQLPTKKDIPTVFTSVNLPQTRIESTETDILTAEEVAIWLRVTPAWVRAHANKNRRPFLPGFKAGKYIRFERETIRLAVAKWQKEWEVL